MIKILNWNKLTHYEQTELSIKIGLLGLFIGIASFFFTISISTGSIILLCLTFLIVGLELALLFFFYKQTSRKGKKQQKVKEETGEWGEGIQIFQKE